MQSKRNERSTTYHTIFPFTHARNALGVPIVKSSARRLSETTLGVVAGGLVVVIMVEVAVVVLGTVVVVGELQPVAEPVIGVPMQ